MTLATFSFTERARPVVEIGIGSAQVPTGSALWDVALWDAPDSLWAGDEPVWRDVTCDVQAVDGDLGRGRLTDPFPTGTCSIQIDNESGWADPGVEVPGVLSVRPGRPIRVGVDHVQFGRRWMFRGFIDQITPTYLPETPDVVELQCIDAFGEAGRAKFAETVVSGADETASERVARILDLVPWLATKRQIEATSVELVGATLDGQAADMLRRCADSAGGACFGDGNGDVVFRGRDWLFHTDDTPLDGTIGNSSTTVESTGYAWTPGTQGNALLSVPDAPPGTAVTPITIIARDRPDGAATSTRRLIAGFAGAGGWQLWVTPGNQLQFVWWTSPTNFAWRVSQPVSDVDRDGWSDLAVEFDAAGGTVAFFRVPTGAEPIPIGNGSFAPSVMEPPTSFLVVGPIETAGSIQRLIIRDGVDGNLTGGNITYEFDGNSDIVDPDAEAITTTSGNTLAVFRNGDPATTLYPSVSTVVPDVCPSEWQRPFARSDIATRVILDRQMPPGADPSTPRVYNDRPSQISYGIEPWERLDLWTRDNIDLDLIGQRTLAQRSAVTMPLVEAVTIDAEASGDNAIDLLTLLDIWRPSRYRCRLIRDGVVDFDRRYFATGIRFHLDPDTWTADISLDWSELYEIPATAARWDQSRWDRAFWT